MFEGDFPVSFPSSVYMSHFQQVHTGLGCGIVIWLYQPHT